MTDGGRNPYASGRGYGDGHGSHRNRRHDGSPNNPYAAPNWGPGVPPQPSRPPYAPHSPYPPRTPPRPRWERFREGDWPTSRELLGRVRLGGCVWALLLFCLWPLLLLLTVYPLARTACRKAHQVFPGHAYPRVVDPFMKRVQDARAWAALVASGLILVAYGAEQTFSDLQEQYFLRVTTTPWLLLLTAPLVVLVVFRLAPPAARPGMRSGLAFSGRAALRYFGAFTAVPLLFVGVVFVNAEYTSSVTLGPLLMLGMLAPVIWALFFVVFASLTLVPSVFGISRVHSGLPALITGVLVWELAAVNLAASGLPPGPLPVQLCAVLGGPASVTAVAHWELKRLRTHYGVTFRAPAARGPHAPNGPA
ncbi:hypothetical protein ACIQJ4_09150 [Streptomyces filamentosus]|uniref:hypothetical protein n=1 Tax=Streptomyces filamentosus TaxID=67294 RepID=UPI003814676C